MRKAFCLITTSWKKYRLNLFRRVIRENYDAAFEMMSIPQNEHKFRFELAPAHNALTSLWLLNFEET